MSDEAFIQLPTDGSGQRVRTFDTVEFDETTGDQYTVAHEAVTLVDEEASPIVRERNLTVIDDEIVQRLDVLLEGIAHLLVLLSETARPKSSTRVLNQWVTQILGGRRHAA